MRKILYFILFIVFTYSCHKDYPRDIPKWLKSKIKELKHGQCGEEHMNIGEYQANSNSEIIYLFIRADWGYQVYDKDGILLCEEWTIFFGTCGSINFSNYSLVRVIWSESC